MTCPLAVFVPEFGARSETFIRRHVQDLLPRGTLAIAGSRGPQTVHDWDATGPLVDLGGVSSPRAVGQWLQDYGVRVMLGEYLDASLPWLGLAEELGIQFFAHAHGYDVSMRLREPHYRREYLRYRDAAGVITMSESSRTRLIDLGLAPGQTHAVPYGVDVPDEFEERSPSAEVGILAVGRMIPKKAPILTLDAFRRATAASTSLHLHYVGSGPLLPAAAQFVRAMQLAQHVTLHGGQQNAVVRDLMARADIFVQHSVTDPDTGDEEGLPVAILEAMASGLPVVTTCHAAIPEAVVDSVTGFLVAEGDTQAMAARITQLAEDRPLRLAMGRAGWSRARERFSWPRERHDLLRILGI